MDNAVFFTDPTTLPEPVACAPIGADWKARINQLWWSRDFAGLDTLPEPDKKTVLRNRELINKVLAFAGEEMCMPTIEDDLQELLTRGVFMYGESAKTIKGRPSQCHQNSCALWEDSRDTLLIMTGYALSLDGMWRQHSWCIEQDGHRIIETTEPRLSYFGFVLTTEEAEAFCDNNLW